MFGIVMVKVGHVSGIFTAHIWSFGGKIWRCEHWKVFSTQSHTKTVPTLSIRKRGHFDCSNATFFWRHHRSAWCIWVHAFGFRFSCSFLQHNIQAFKEEPDILDQHHHSGPFFNFGTVGLHCSDSPNLCWCQQLQTIRKLVKLYIHRWQYILHPFFFYLPWF